MRIRPLVIAVTVAGIGAFLLFMYQKRLELEVSGGRPVAVLVTLQALEPGGALRTEMLAERSIPEAYLDPRAIRATDRPRITGLKVLNPLQAQDSLLWSDITAASDDRREVSALVQPGMRAFVIRGEGRSSTLVHPGDRVDVVATFPQQGNPEVRTAVVLLQNILVLARGGDTEDSRRSEDSTELALSVPLSSAQLLAVAVEKGKLSVALRNRDDARVQEGLTDVTSTILAEAEKRAAAIHPRVGPQRMEGVGR